MTPPIGFRSDSPHDKGTLLETGAAASVAPAGGEAVKVSPSADYAYRIAALTAGLALIATFL